MRKFVSASLMSAFVTLPLFAGAFTLQVDDPKTISEAVSRNAIVVAHITACRSPEKTTVMATAEGIVDGKRQTTVLKVIPLSEPGAFAVAREWPLQGTWVVKMIATNPDYKDHPAAVIVPIQSGEARLAAVKVFHHAPSPDETDSALKQTTF